jgi:hypothetical protein
MRAIAGAIVILAAALVFFAATTLAAANAAAGVPSARQYENSVQGVGMLAAIGLAVFGLYLIANDGRPTRAKPLVDHIEEQIATAIRADAAKNRAP